MNFTGHDLLGNSYVDVEKYMDHSMVRCRDFLVLNISEVMIYQLISLENWPCQPSVGYRYRYPLDRSSMLSHKQSFQEIRPLLKSPLPRRRCRSTLSLSVAGSNARAAHSISFGEARGQILPLAHPPHPQPPTPERGVTSELADVDIPAWEKTVAVADALGLAA